MRPSRAITGAPVLRAAPASAPSHRRVRTPASISRPIAVASNNVDQEPSEGVELPTRRQVLGAAAAAAISVVPSGTRLTRGLFARLCYAKAHSLPIHCISARPRISMLCGSDCIMTQDTACEASAVQFGATAVGVPAAHRRGYIQAGWWWAGGGEQ
jgi:hypothetical protein